MQYTINHASYVFFAIQRLSLKIFFSSFALSQCLWSFFNCCFGLSQLPNFLVDVWASWRTKFGTPLKATWDFMARTIIWNIQLEHNKHIFNFAALLASTITLKITHVLVPVVCSSKFDKSKDEGFDQHGNTQF